MMVVKEEFSLMEGMEDLSVEEYAELVFQNNPTATDAQLHTNDGDMNWFDYYYLNTDMQIEFHFMTYIYKTNDAFWLVQFATPREISEEMAPQIRAWAESVSFS